jgi:hypothetical protein
MEAVIDIHRTYPYITEYYRFMSNCAGISYSASANSMPQTYHSPIWEAEASHLVPTGFKTELQASPQFSWEEALFSLSAYSAGETFILHDKRLFIPVKESFNLFSSAVHQSP